MDRDLGRVVSRYGGRNESCRTQEKDGEGVAHRGASAGPQLSNAPEPECGGVLHIFFALLRVWTKPSLSFSFRRDLSFCEPNTVEPHQSKAPLANVSLCDEVRTAAIRSLLE